MCTLEKRGSIFILTLTGTDEHRLNPNLLDAMSAALRRVRSESSSTPSALITTSHGKFFSNGFDLAWAKSSGVESDVKDRAILMSSKLRSLIADLISLPMPTIAAVCGHASAAGYILALSHDYVLMRNDRGFLYMNETDIGLKFPAWFIALLGHKVGSPVVRRDIVLKAEKIRADVAVERGIIDSAHAGADETVRAAVRLGEELVGRKWKGDVYGMNRAVLYDNVLKELGSNETDEFVDLVTRAISRL